MKIYNLYIICISLLFSACNIETGGGRSGQSQGSWLSFRADASMSGYTDVRLPKNPVLQWAYKSDLRTASSPLVLDGTAYWSDRRGRIQGVDREGNLCFSYDFATAIEAIPAIHDSVLYIGRIDGRISALSLSTKDTLWNYETDGQILAAPNFIDVGGRKVLVCGSYDNYLYTLDLKTGEEISNIETGYYINGAVALWQGHVIFGGCDALIRMIDCLSGVETSSMESEAYIPSSPAIIGDYCYIADYAGNIYEIYLKDGKFEQTRKIVSSKSKDAAFISVPAVTNKTLYLVSDDRNVYSIDRTTGLVNWKYLLKGETSESSPVVCRDQLIVCTRTGIVSILNAKTGELAWEYDTGEQITASPAVIKGAFYILTSKGTLFCFGE